MRAGGVTLMLDERALIDPAAKLSDGVSVGPFSIIEADVEIGSGTRIGPNVVIRSGTRIGRNNRFFQFSSIGEDPQDKKYAGEKTFLEIGDGNTFREFCTLNRGTTQDEGVTRIGNNNWLMAYCHVAHDCMLGDEIILANNATLAGHVHVSDYAILGGFVGVHQFCRIGTHAFVGNSLGITRDIPPYVMVAGPPAAPRGLNTEGLKRRGFSREQLANIRTAYRTVYRSELRLEEAIAILSEGLEKKPELLPFVEFLKNTKRSIIR